MVNAVTSAGFRLRLGLSSPEFSDGLDYYRGGTLPLPRLAPTGERARRNHVPHKDASWSGLGHKLLGSCNLTRKQETTNHLTTPSWLSRMASLVSAEQRTRKRPQDRERP